MYKQWTKKESRVLIIGDTHCPFDLDTYIDFLVDTYTFKNDYFFLMDDNRDHPNDSRIMGFIPESHLLGTCKRILFSD